LVKATDIDCLAPALGSVHGPYKGEPNLRLKEMEEISSTIDLPLVLHGGTGIPIEDIQRSISLGSANINVNTENQIAQTKAIRGALEENTDGYHPPKDMGPRRGAIKAPVLEKMRECGSSTKA